MKNFKKAQIAGAVMLATMGLAVGTAQADSLWAPLIINTSNGAFGTNMSTYLNIKMKGTGGPDLLGRPVDPLHYVWIRKGTTLQSLSNLTTPCTMVNNTGAGSRNDLVFQDTNKDWTSIDPISGVANNSYYPGTDGTIAPDNSRPRSYTAGDFVGMVVVSDLDNAKPEHTAPEGDMSGFAYIVNDDTGDVTSYKLLNNHHSAEEGNMSAGFMSKKVVDFSWMSSAGLGPQTGWTVAVASKDMTKHDAPFGTNYDATVMISQNTAPGQDSPLDISNGQNVVYNNDEGTTSGPTGTSVTCMGQFTRATLLNNDPQMLADTANGGWLRRSIIPVAADAAGVAYDKLASGAIIYRGDVLSTVNPVPQVTMEVETSGHLSPGHNHANRPY